MSDSNPIERLEWIDPSDLTDLLREHGHDDEQPFRLWLSGAGQWWVIASEFDSCTLIPACDEYDSADEVREYAYDLLGLHEGEVTIETDAAESLEAA